jgi:uncharacterized protein YfaP (DUF2135 family)
VIELDASRKPPLSDEFRMEDEKPIQLLISVSSADFQSPISDLVPHVELDASLQGYTIAEYQKSYRTLREDTPGSSVDMSSPSSMGSST